MILKQKNLHVFSCFFFIGIHFLEADTGKCVSRFADIDPEYIFSKKLFAKSLCALSAGQSIDKCRMNMQDIRISKQIVEQCFHAGTFGFILIGHCRHYICKICRFTLHIIRRIFRFHDLIQTGSVHFDKFLCLNGSKLCTGSLYIQCCIVFYRSITASCQNVSRIAAVCV